MRMLIHIENEVNHCQPLHLVRVHHGFERFNALNYDRALKHYMIAVRGGDNDSLDVIKIMLKLKRGHATKEDYSKALVARQAYLDEIKSPQRDEAAAFGEQYKYY